MKVTRDNLAQQFNEIIAHLGAQGVADVDWAEYVTKPEDAVAFALEALFVICNSGMKNTIARQIFQRCRQALHDHRPITDVFAHPGKANAMQTIWNTRHALFDAFLKARDSQPDTEVVDWLQANLPWIGSITKYHLAKNYGIDVAKPDVHLKRLQDHTGLSPQALCEYISQQTGYRVGTVDVILWRACANGVIDSRAGYIYLENVIGD